MLTYVVMCLGIFFTQQKSIIRKSNR